MLIKYNLFNTQLDSVLQKYQYWEQIKASILENEQKNFIKQKSLLIFFYFLKLSSLIVFTNLKQQKWKLIKRNFIHLYIFKGNIGKCMVVELTTHQCAHNATVASQRTEFWACESVALWGKQLYI